MAAASDPVHTTKGRLAELGLLGCTQATAFLSYSTGWTNTNSQTDVGTQFDYWYGCDGGPYLGRNGGVVLGWCGWDSRWTYDACGWTSFAHDGGTFSASFHCVTACASTEVAHTLTLSFTVDNAGQITCAYAASTTPLQEWKRCEDGH